MDANRILNDLALVFAVVVGIIALVALRAEWKKTALEDHITKIMMILLSVGCIEVLLVTFGVWGRKP
jgi:hypothetical protein